MTDEDRGALLKAACDAVIAAEELRPEYDLAGNLLKTFCNLGAQRVAKAMGQGDLLDDPKVEENADALHELLVKNGKKVGAADAVLHALDGGLAFAVMTSAQLREKHGHIAAVRPEGMQRSTTVGFDVPIVANVGRGDPAAPLVATARKGVKTKRNWNCRASSAFPMKEKGAPDYFIL